MGKIADILRKNLEVGIEVVSPPGKIVVSGMDKAEAEIKKWIQKKAYEYINAPRGKNLQITQITRAMVLDEFMRRIENG